MKKQSRTTTVHRINLEAGKYTTLSRSILINPNIRDSSKTLIQLLLNNVEDWILVLSYYQKQLQWSNDKMAGAVADLIQNGYLKKQKHSKGKDKGFYYTYVISEFGNLNPNKEQVNEEDIISIIKQEDAPNMVTRNTDVKVQSEPTTEKTELKCSDLTDKPVEPQKTDSASDSQPTPVVDYMLWDRVFVVLEEELQGILDVSFAQKVADYYSNQMETGKLVQSNFNEVSIRSLLQDKIAGKRKIALDELTKLIDLFNDRGTKDQRAIIKSKALDYFQDSVNQCLEITRAEVSLKMLKLKQAVVEANRNLDQRYQN